MKKSGELRSGDAAAYAFTLLFILLLAAALLQLIPGVEVGSKSAYNATLLGLAVLCTVCGLGYALYDGTRSGD